MNPIDCLQCRAYLGNELVVLGAADELRAYSVGDVVYLEFAAAGDYNVQVYNIAGQLVAAKAAELTSSDRMQVRLPMVGAYVLRVFRDGKEVKALKLLRD